MIFALAIGVNFSNKAIFNFLKKSDRRIVQDFLTSRERSIKQARRVRKIIKKDGIEDNLQLALATKAVAKILDDQKTDDEFTRLI